VSGKALLRALKNLSHDDAVEYVLQQANDHIRRSGVYRVGRLFVPGDLTISFVPARHGGRYQLDVRNEQGRITSSFSGLEIHHAVLDLLTFWEEEPHEGPGIVS
jgi:hypothetical protein